MLVDLGQDVYQEEYERHLLAEAATWYRLEAAEFVASCACPDYLRKVLRPLSYAVSALATPTLMPCLVSDATGFADIGIAVHPTAWLLWSLSRVSLPHRVGCWTVCDEEGILLVRAHSCATYAPRCLDRRSGD